MQRLKIQHLIATGIYTALYFILMALCLLVLRFMIPGFHNLLLPGVTLIQKVLSKFHLKVLIFQQKAKKSI